MAKQSVETAQIPARTAKAWAKSHAQYIQRLAKQFPGEPLPSEQGAESALYTIVDYR